MFVPLLGVVVGLTEVVEVQKLKKTTDFEKLMTHFVVEQTA